MLLALAGTLFDIVLSMLPGWEISTVPDSVPAWFAQLDAKPLLGLRNLDLLNAVIIVLGLPVSLALFGAHRKTAHALAALALAAGVIGTVVFVSNNAALPMLQLSRDYSAAAGAERRALEGAAAALLAKGAHGSPGAFWGLFLLSISTLLMSVAMLLGRVFARATALIGVAGMTLLIIYTIGVTFATGSESIMMVFAMPGGILILAWDVLVAVKLFRLYKLGI
jgi:hypothetical protein